MKDFTALLNVARQTAGLDKVAAPTAPKEASKEDKERDAAFAAQQKEYWDVRRELETYGFVCVRDCIPCSSAYTLSIENMSVRTLPATMDFTCQSDRIQTTFSR